MKTNKILLFAIILFIGVVFQSKGQTTQATNAITTGSYLGTSNNIDVIFKRNNTFCGSINDGGSTIGPFNTAFGLSTGTSGNNNSFFGNSAGGSITTGVENIFLGGSSGLFCTSGNSNLMAGFNSGRNCTTGSNNVFLGRNSGINATTSSNNTIVGFNSGTAITTGDRNTFVGVGCGSAISTGRANTFIGNVVSLVSPIIEKTIILSDGDSNQRLYIHSNGYTGIGTITNAIPQNMLEVKSIFLNDASKSSGLRFTNLTNAVAPISNPSSLTDKGVLSVNASGDVILVKDIGGGISNSCTSQYNVPLTTGTNGNLGCSQIYDNGLSVSIGTPITNQNSLLYNSTGLGNTNTSLPVTGNLRLNINGVTRGVAFLSTSDKKFKKDIKPIENALKTIEAIDGKTYLWNKEANKDMNFDDGGHSGFIAQELEKVLPHLVATGSNGDKSVNYLELLPYLVEGMKEQQKMINEQQTQIEELKGLITNNFRSQNQDLIQFENTKIISVSPNPSNDVISVSINVEKLVQTATLNVYDLNGKLLNNLIINERATNIIKTLQKDNFGKGIYIVSLTVNGKSIDSKKIIFN